jgi:hypothetical protein
MRPHTVGERLQTGLRVNGKETMERTVRTECGASQDTA